MKWLGDKNHGLEGVMAKPLGEPYRPGRRVMLKLKRRQTFDRVVAGYYADETTRIANSLPLGPYDNIGNLHYVGHARLGREANGVMDLLKQLEADPALPELNLLSAIAGRARSATRFGLAWQSGDALPTC